MITLITGVPGAGKTYLSLHLMISQFYEKVGDEYLIKKRVIQKDGKNTEVETILITNVDGLKLNHIPLSEAMGTKTFEEFFTKDHQEKVSKKYPAIIYVIDECQQYLHKRMSNKDCIFYFDWHRHLGHEIYLITQDIRKISLDISTLVETEYKALKPSFQIPGTLKYNVKSGGVVFETKTVRKNKKLFQLYKSFQGVEQKVKRPKVFYYLLIIMIIIPVLCYFAYQKWYSKVYGEESYVSTNRSVTIDEKSKSGVAYASEGFPVGSVAEIEKEIIVAIGDHVSIGGQLVAFRCPKSNKLIKPLQVDYKVFMHQGAYYARVKESDLFSVIASEADGHKAIGITQRGQL